jgi:hypothetical protein
VFLELKHPIFSTGRNVKNVHIKFEVHTEGLNNSLLQRKTEVWVTLELGWHRLDNQGIKLQFTARTRDSSRLQRV